MFKCRRHIYLIATAFLLLLVLSCEETITHKGKTPLLSVDKEYLYREDVEQLLASHKYSASDSVAFANEYMRHWLEDVLLYRMARRNVPDSKDIERLVDSYRKALFLNIYQERLVTQQLEREISDSEIALFYEQNKEMFLIDEPMLQGLYLKVSSNAPRLNSVRKWYKSNRQEDIENLEKYSLTNAVVYEYFMDNWLSLSSLAAKMPITADDLFERLKRDDYIEFEDSTHLYFVNASCLLRKGEQKPLDLASAEIRELLINSIKANFIKEVKRNLYNDALQSGDVKFYDEQSSVQLQKTMQNAE